MGLLQHGRLGIIERKYRDPCVYVGRILKSTPGLHDFDF
jgi:hypothetical protein